MKIKKYAVIRSPEDYLTVEQIIEATGSQAALTLWCGSEGQFRLLPKEVIQNLLDLHEGLQRTSDPEYKIPMLKVVWSQGIEIDSSVGRILMGE